MVVQKREDKLIDEINASIDASKNALEEYISYIRQANNEQGTEKKLELLCKANEAYKRYEGKTLRVLCEGRGRTDESLFTGKSRQNIIVDFDGDESMIGKFVDVKITCALNWALVGEVIK